MFKKRTKKTGGWVEIRKGGCLQTCTRFPNLAGVKWNVQLIYVDDSTNETCMNWFCFCSVLHEEKHNLPAMVPKGGFWPFSGV